MCKKVFRPFWSLDIIKTEEWLCEMSAKGYYLKKIEAVSKVFVFQEDECKAVSYRICFHKPGINITSQSLLKNGWYSVFSKGKWSILANGNDKSQIKIHPSRESILKRNRIIKYTISALLTIYLMMSLIPMLLIMSMIFSSNNSSSNVIFMPGSKVSILLILLVLTSLVCITIKLNKSDKNLRMESGTALTLSSTIPKDENIDYGTEKKLRKDGKVIKKIKLAWFYSPDRAEDWLESMEIQGYNLYRMSRLGNTFYFMKGEPRKVKYCLDYQTTTNDSYFEIHRSNGWKMLFTSFSNFTKYTLWGKEYSYEKPALYSDASHIIKHATKQCRTYCILFIPIIIMYLFLIVLNLKMYSRGIEVFWPTLIIFSVVIVEFGYFITKSLRYYLRIKKKIS